ncbi:MAG TPA: TetR/AcrR family transcriptional regulator [Hyphomicrobiaceae bacterium]|nr:TetR/AcrR family transcriptional regulator [Hyphomicrobiaceae bacterium]
MSWKKGPKSGDGDDGQDGRRGYHHGNLREALIAAALDLISRKGPAGFTFAEAARQAGVSPAAPYRHYKDREALLADVAEQGFIAFEQSLSAAWDNGRGGAGPALKRMGLAYLHFATTSPAWYSAMFESGLPMSAYPKLHASGERALGLLRTACEALVADLPAGKRPPAMMMALHIWSLSHGIAGLFARGDGARRPLPMPPEDLLEAGILVYLDGLGIPKQAR